MRRILALVTVASAVAIAAPAHAKPFTYTDAKGDAPAGAGVDIVGVTYATEGETIVEKRGRKTVRTYQPTKLVVTMALAAAPMEQAGVKYRVDATVSECGDLSFTYAPTLAQDVLSNSQMSLACGGPAGTAGGDTLFLDPKFAVKGSKLIWSVNLKALPKQARAGALLYNLRAIVDVTEPVLGTLGPGDFGNSVLDSAKSDGDWEIS